MQGLRLQVDVSGGRMKHIRQSYCSSRSSYDT